jgi:hypothetical protein
MAATARITSMEKSHADMRPTLLRKLFFRKYVPAMNANPYVTIERWSQLANSSNPG